MARRRGGALALALAALLCLSAPCHGAIERLEIRNDARVMFTLDTFGFDEGGELNLTLTKLAMLGAVGADGGEQKVRALLPPLLLVVLVVAMVVQLLLLLVLLLVVQQLVLLLLLSLPTQPINPEGDIGFLVSSVDAEFILRVEEQQDVCLVDQPGLDILKSWEVRAAPATALPACAFPAEAGACSMLLLLEAPAALLSILS